MPRYDRRYRMGRGRRRMRGRGLMDFLGKANNFLQNSKIISTVAPEIPVVGPIIGGLAGLLGYGRRRGRPKIYTKHYRRRIRRL